MCWGKVGGGGLKHSLNGIPEAVVRPGPKTHATIASDCLSETSGYKPDQDHFAAAEIA